MAIGRNWKDVWVEAVWDPVWAPDNADVTVALTGQAVTASAGSIAPETSQALAGASLTASAGSITPETSQALAGASLTASAGTLTPSLGVALSGAAVTTEAGQMAALILGDVTIALTGQAVAVSAGTITASVPSTEIPEGARGGGGGGRHRGWSEKDASRKRKRDKDLEDAIRKMYRDLTQDPDTAEAAGEIVAAIAPKKAGRIPKPAAVAFNQITDEIETGIRMLHQELAALKRARQEEEDEVREIFQILDLID